MDWMRAVESEMGQIDLAAKAYADFLRAIGLTEANSGIDIEDSARNTAELMVSWMRGVSEPRPELSRMPSPDTDIVVLRDLPFYSFCGHHFVPFFGTVDIEYKPDRYIAGLGGFTRVIDYYARRPQFQECLCFSIAQHIYQDLEPKAVRVRLNARQMCLELHGKGAGILIEAVKCLGSFD
jgi:GTP cyclohydrolase I